MDAFYDVLRYPETARLDRRVPKKMMLDHADLTPADKKALAEDVEKLTWKYALKGATVGVLPYTDHEREYLEVAIIEVELRDRRRADRIAELVQRVIPYPVLLVLVQGGGIRVNVAHKRFSRAEAGRIVATGPLQTPWMVTPLSGLDLEFSNALALPGLSTLNFLSLYEGMVAAVLARSAAELTGAFRIESGRSEDDRRRVLERCLDLEREIGRMRAELNEETRFAEKVDLNTKIKGLEAALAKSKGEL